MKARTRGWARCWLVLVGVAACGGDSTGGEGGGGSGGSGGGGGDVDAIVEKCPDGAGDAHAEAEALVGSACAGELECSFVGPCSACTVSCVDGVFEEANCTDAGDGC